MTRIQMRRGTAAAWTSANPILAAGEHGFETDTGAEKIGDGATAWASLPYGPGKLVAEGELAFNVKDYGAVADYNGTTGTDNTAAFTAALAATPSGAKLFIPAGRYYFGSSFPAVTKPIEMAGSAPGMDGGLLGAQLNFAAGASGPSIPVGSGNGWYWHDFEVKSKSTGAGADVGIYIQGGGGTLKRVNVVGFGSHGIWFRGGATYGGGNVNNSVIERVRAYGNRGDGIFLEGSDANAILIMKSDCVANYGWAINLEGNAATVIISPHANHTFFGSPGAYRDNGTTNSWYSPYAEGNGAFKIESGGTYGRLLMGNYAKPALDPLASSHGSWEIMDGGYRYGQIGLKDIMAGTTKWDLSSGVYASGVLTLGVNGGNRVFRVSNTVLDVFWWTNLKPHTTVATDLGGTANVWRDTYAQQDVRPLATQTISYALLSSDNVVFFNGSSLTATLPAPAAGVTGRRFTVKNLHATALTVVSAGSSKTIDGVASAQLLQYEKAVYVTDGTQWYTLGGGSSSPITADVQFFSGSGTWTKPSSAKTVTVTLIPGGAGGGSGRRGAAATVRGGGGGGGTGWVTRREFDAADLTATVAVTVGTGGAGGAAIAVDDTNGSDGVAGLVSTFGAFCSTPPSARGIGGSTTGGLGGSSPNATTNSGSGAGAAGGTGVVGASAASNFWGAGSGGGGGGISSGNAAFNGGGAAGSYLGATAGVGGAAGVVDTTVPTGGTAATVKGTPGPGAGGGAASLTTAAQAGANAVNYGGGGGGGGASLNGNNSGAGGNGAAGAVLVVTYF